MAGYYLANTPDKSIKAFEHVRELSRKELISARDSLQAWENVSAYSRKELMDKEQETEAYDKILSFSNNERVFMNKVMEAWENTMGLGRTELLRAYEQIKLENHHEAKRIYSDALSRYSQSKFNFKDKIKMNFEMNSLHEVLNNHNK